MMWVPIRQHIMRTPGNDSLAIPPGATDWYPDPSFLFGLLPGERALCSQICWQFYCPTPEITPNDGTIHMEVSPYGGNVWMEQPRHVNEGPASRWPGYFNDTVNLDIRAFEPNVTNVKVWAYNISPLPMTFYFAALWTIERWELLA